MSKKAWSISWDTLFNLHKSILPGSVTSKAHTVFKLQVVLLHQSLNGSEEVFASSTDNFNQAEEVIHNLLRPGVTVTDQNCKDLSSAGVSRLVNEEGERLAIQLFHKLIREGNTKHSFAEGACLRVSKRIILVLAPGTPKEKKLFCVEKVKLKEKMLKLFSPWVLHANKYTCV